MSDHVPRVGTEAGEQAFARTARGAVLLLAGRGLARVGNFAFLILLARQAGSDQVGEFVTAQVIGLLLLAGLDYGLGTLYARDLAPEGSNAGSTIRAAARVRATVTAASLPLVIVLGGGSQSRTIDFLFVWLAMVLDASAGLLVAGARRDLQVARLAAIEAVRSWGAPVAFLILNACLHTVVRPEWVRFAPYASLSIASLASASLVAVWCTPFIRRELAQPLRAGTRYWREGLALSAATVAVGLHNRVDLLLLRALEPPSTAAWYAAAYAFVNSTYLVPIMVSYLLLPQLASFRPQSSELNAAVEMGSRVLLLVGSGIGIALGVCSPFILGITYGGEYARGATALAVLAAAVPIVFTSNLYGNVLLSHGRQSAVLAYVTLAALLNAALNLLLIPHYSLTGSAIATLVAELFMMLASARALARSQLPAPSGPRIVTILLLMLLPLASALPTLHLGFHVFRVSLAVCVWYLVSRASSLLRPRELRHLLALRKTSDLGK